MNRVVRGVFVALLACVACNVWAATQLPFSRYQVILTRKPFGEIKLPPGPPPGSQPPMPQIPPFINDLRMCAITENELGTRVGFVNIKTKPMESYFIFVGDSTEDGTDITVVKADYEQERALLSKDGQEYWVYMSEAPEVAGPEGGSTAQEATSANAAIAAKKISYAERLRKRREALRVKPVRGSTTAMPDAPKLTGKELDEHLKQYQMDLIRKGMPPLPMALTEEMDAQLVAEGVLPPAE